MRSIDLVTYTIQLLLNNLKYTGCTTKGFDKGITFYFTFPTFLFKITVQLMFVLHLKYFPFLMRTI